MPKAILVKKYGPPQSLTYEDCVTPEPQEGQVTIQVMAAGVNFPDTLIIQGKYQFQPPFPFSPGGEVSGVVTAVHGKSRFKVGDKVLAMVGWGGYAEEIVVDASKLVPIPPGMDFDVAAGFVMTYGTSIYALKNRGNVKPGDVVLVLGAAGGVGLSAVELAKAMGATVIAAASTDDKLQVCKQYGADHLINYTSENLKNRIKDITDGNGVDVVYDPVGGDYANIALRSMAWNGRYLVIGFTAGIPALPFNLALLKGCSIVGVFWGRFLSVEPQAGMENNMLLVKWFQEKKIKPLVTQKYALKDAPKAIQDMMDRKVKGKAILITDAYEAASPSRL